MSKIISVVIPVYNVEKYLRECLDSVVNQTYKNLQIILVDDGSTDSSGKICDEYADKDSRITVIHQENAGAGAAKNTGLELISGEYLSLIDSDDYIEKNMYEVMLNYLEEKNVDVVQCCFDEFYVNKKIKKNFCFYPEKSRVFSSYKYLYEMLSDWKYAVFWNKLFKTSLLKDIRFPEGRKIDDEFFTYKLICNAKKIANINDCFYHYRMRSNSVMNKNQSKILLLDRIDAFKERYEYVSQKYPAQRKVFYQHLCEYLLFYHNDLTDQDIKNELNQNINLYPYKKLGIVLKIKNKLLFRNYVIDRIDDNIDKGVFD